MLLVRQMLVTALHGSFAAKSAELLRSGHCWHSVRWKVEADQEAREEQMPEGVFTVGSRSVGRQASGRDAGGALPDGRGRTTRAGPTVGPSQPHC